MNSNILNIVNKITKPTSCIDLKSLIDESSCVRTDSALDEYLQENISENEKQLNLWQFIRLYKIGQIPIIDFVVTYIVLYLFNLYYFHFDYKFILMMTILVVILFNMFL